MGGRGEPRKRKALTPVSESESLSEAPEDYALKRHRNNAAVCKTRQKKRQEENETNSRVNQLREENEVLERKVEAMKSELKLLKEMIVAVAPAAKPEEEKKK
uniref:BZIP domain-containing protein n=1 Tax=Panagrellus redivivus TaxID=6233 RepID=A0A7E4UL59_PANRE